MLINGVSVVERGWAGHFICADKCRFRRNTLLTYKDRKWVVSTVGAMYVNLELDTIGAYRYFETMAFWAKDDQYNDADVRREIDIDGECGIYADSKEELFEKYPLPDLVANEMHDRIVAELIEKIRSEEVC